MTEFHFIVDYALREIVAARAALRLTSSNPNEPPLINLREIVAARAALRPVKLAALIPVSLDSERLLLRERH